MTSDAPRSIVSGICINTLLMVVCLASDLCSQCRADQVEMQNGDRYAGKVLSLDTNTVVIHSEVLGIVRLPRTKVSWVAVGTNSRTNSHTEVTAAISAPGPASTSGTKQSPELSGLARQLSVNSNLLQKVQAQFLSSAGPEATQKFDELLGGLLSGKLNLNDIRSQAQSAASQLRAAKQELGSEAGWAIDGYLAILDRFLKDSSWGASAPAPSKAPKAALESAEEE